MVYMNYCLGMFANRLTGVIEGATKKTLVCSVREMETDNNSTYMYMYTYIVYPKQNNVSTELLVPGHTWRESYFSIALAPYRAFLIYALHACFKLCGGRIGKKQFLPHVIKTHP